MKRFVLKVTLDDNDALTDQEAIDGLKDCLDGYDYVDVQAEILEPTIEIPDPE